MTAFSHNFQGISGSWYRAEMRDLPTAANDRCGVYVFGRRRPDNLFDILYIGRASRMCDRLTQSHEKLAPALGMGMTTLGQIECANDSVADLVERDLIASFQPVLNQRLR